MKKTTLLLVLSVFALGCMQVYSQIVNEPANWPNANWSITGAFSASGFASDPTTTANFSWDDDLAGSGSLFDDIAAESPIIDISGAIPTEQQLQVEVDYVYRRAGDVLSLEWWDQGTGTWQVWQQFANNSNNLDYKGCTGFQNFVSQPLIISGFTTTQLVNFRYRIRYNDNGFDWGMCFGSPTLTSLATANCLEVSAITIDPANITANQAEVSWTDNNGVPPANGWEIEYGPAGFAQGTGTVEGTTINPYTITGLSPNTAYDVYIRALCSAADTSGWIGPITFTTEAIPEGCGGQFVDSGGATGQYSNNENETTTFCPDNPGDVVTVNFLSFNTEANFDDLTIYDGPDTASPNLGVYDGTDLPPTFTSTHPSGCLTFVFDSDGSVVRDGWVANIICAPPPTCFAPNNLTVTAITQDGANIGWNDTNTPPAANGFEVEIVPSGTVPTGTGVVTMDNPYMATGLDASTLYDVYVRAICDDGGMDDPSFWVATSFSTLVAPPECGGQFVDSGGPGGDYSNNELETYIICPDVGGEVVTVQFTSFMLETNFDDLTIYNGDSTAAPLLGTFDGNELPPSFTSTHPSGCLTFVFDSDGSVTQDGWTADVLCSPPPTCFAVTDILIDNVLNNEVTLSWTDTLNSVPPTVYIIEYGPVGFAQGTGTIVNAPTNPYTVMGLNSQTEYEFYVQASCDPSDQSFWAGPVQATTLCDVFVAPYVEDFEDGGVIDICWSQGAGNLENWQFANDVAAPGHVGNDDDVGGTTTMSNGYFAWVDDSFAHNTGTTLISPLVDVSGLTTPALSFYYVSHDEGNTHVDFSVDVWDGATWNVGVFTSATNTAGWEQVFINLDVLPITGPVAARFIVDENNGGDFYDDVAIDDVRFDEAPTCFNVTNLTVDGQTTTTADISWIDNNSVAPIGGWDVEYGISGFAQGTGTVINVPLPTPSTTLMGLVPSTNYDVYVRANCAADDSDSSLWTGPVVIRTDDAPPPNDTCATAIPMTVNIDCQNILGNNILATSSTDLEGEVLPDCADPAANGAGAFDAFDVWFSFAVPPTGNVAIETSDAGGMVDTVLAAYSGTCGNLVELDCQDDSVINPQSDDFRFSSITLRDLTPGEIIYVRVWSYTQYISDGDVIPNVQGAFNICVYGQSRGFDALGTGDLVNDIQWSYYPNPVEDVLTINSEEEISQIAIYSLLGQEVMQKQFDNGQTNVSIDTQQLSTGTYIAKAMIGNTIKTFKVIKR